MADQHVRDYAIYTITLDGIIDEWNQSLQRFGGWEATDVQGMHIGRFFPGGASGSPEPTALLADAANRLGRNRKLAAGAGRLSPLGLR